MSERGLKTSTVTVVTAKFEFLRHDPNYFLSGAIDNHGRNPVILLWPGDKATINEEAAWRLTSPQNFRVQQPAGKFSSWFFGIKMASSSFIIFQAARLSTRSIIHLCWCNGRTFWKKKPAGMSPMESYSCTTMPLLTWHLQPRSNWPTWASIVSISHPILRTWPCPTTTCSLDWQNNWMVAIFLLTWRSFLSRRPGWTEKILNFFWEACIS